jgi:hypothetical protein
MVANILTKALPSTGEALCCVPWTVCEVRGSVTEAELGALGLKCLLL